MPTCASHARAWIDAHLPDLSEGQKLSMEVHLQQSFKDERQVGRIAAFASIIFQIDHTLAYYAERCVSASDMSKRFLAAKINTAERLRRIVLHRQTVELGRLPRTKEGHICLK